MAFSYLRTEIYCPYRIRQRQFVHKFLFTIFVPLDPPPPNQQNEGFPLEFLLKEPQTKLRTLSQNCEQNLRNLRTNRIVFEKKRAFLINNQHPLRGGFAKGGFCRHDFMEVCVEQMQVTHAQTLRVGEFPSKLYIKQYRKRRNDEDNESSSSSFSFHCFITSWSQTR